MSRRASCQSDDGSLFAQLEGNDLFVDLPDDVDDNLPVIAETASCMEPTLALNPIRIPYEASQSQSLLMSSNTRQSGAQMEPSMTISSVPSKRGPGRPRKDGKVPIQRKNLFPGRPRMRGRKTIMGTPSGLIMDSNNIPNAPSTSSNMSSFNIGSCGMTSMKPMPVPNLPRIPSDPGKVEMGLSSGVYVPSSSQIHSSSNFQVNSDESSLDFDAKINSRICSFCNLGENSSLGLGELIRCDPSPGFSPFKRSIRLRRSPDTDSSAPNSSDVPPLNSPLRIGKSLLQINYFPLICT